MAVASSAATISLSVPSTSRRRVPISASSTVSASLCSSFSAPTSLFLKNTNRSVQDPARTPGGTRNQRNFSCTCLFGLGVPELVVIAGVAALVFGPKKLPEVGRSIGKTVKSFQQAAKEFESELKKDADPSSASVEKPTAASEEEKQETKVSSTKESS